MPTEPFDLDPALARLLAEHSPRLVISRPALVPSASSPTGWLLVVPGDDDA
jgi:hypothetical protein